MQNLSEQPRGPVLNDMHYDFQRWLIDDIQELQYMENSLQGLILDMKTGTYVKAPGVKGLMNETGAKILTQFYLMNFLKDAKLSNIDEDTLMRFLENNANDLNDFITERRAEFEIQSESDIQMIIRVVLNKVELGLRRSLYGAEQQRLGDTTTQKVVSEQRVVQPSNVDEGRSRLMQNLPFS